MYLRQKQLQPNMTHAACCVSVQAVNFYSCVRAYLLSMKEAVRVVKVSVCVCVCVSLLFSADFRRSCHGSSHQAHTESSASPLTDTLHGMFSFTSFHYVVSVSLPPNIYTHPNLFCLPFPLVICLYPVLMCHTFIVSEFF